MRLNRVDYYWRLFANAFSFAIFGVGGVLIPIVAFPVLYLWPGSRIQRQRRARRLIQLTFKAFIYMMRGLRVLTWKIDGIEKLQRDSILVLANHPTLVDVVFLVSFIPNADCIVKNQLLANPVMRGFLSLTGYISNDQGEALINAAKTSLQTGSALIVFPEGTRTQPGGALAFRRGAANIAIRARVYMTPVVIQCNAETLSKQHKWHHIPDQRLLISFSVKDDIHIEPFLSDNAPLAARRLTRYLENYFTEECNSNGRRCA